MRGPAWVFWLYGACWLAYASCLVLYGLRSPWWRGWTGRALLAVFASLTAVLTLALVLRWFAMSLLDREVWFAVTLGAVAVAGFGLLAVLIYQQRRDRATADRPEKPLRRPGPR